MKTKKLLSLLLLGLLCSIGNVWGSTTAPTGAAHKPGDISEGNLVSANGRKYEVFFSNNAALTSFLVGSNTSATTETTGTSKWCNIGSGCGNNNNNISTAFTLGEFVSNVKSSNNKAIRVQSTASSEKNIVMVVQGYDSIAILGKSNDLSVYAEVYNEESYGASTALTLVKSISASSHSKRSFALDSKKQYRLTIAYGTSGSTNKDFVAFSLCIPTKASTESPSISPASKNFSEGFNATITKGSDNEYVVYTTDGSTPAASEGTATNGTKFTGSSEVIAIATGANKTIKAIGYNSSHENSDEVSVTYTYVDPRTELTAAWSNSAPTFKKDAVATIPTFTVTGGTLGTDYSVSYSLESGSLADVNSSTGITAIRTSAAGTATVRATVTVLNTASYRMDPTYFDCVITVAEAPTSGTLFSLVMSSATLSGVTQNTEVDLSTYATISGGDAYLGNKNATASKAQIVTTGDGSVYFSGNDAYVKIVLDWPLKTGDVISFGSGKTENQICFTTSNTRTTTYSTSSYTYTCAVAFNDVSTIYIWRKESAETYLHSLTITRPHTVTLTADTWASFCPSFNVTIPTDDDKMKVYRGEYNPSTGELTATAVDATKLKAGEGVLLKTTTAGTTSHVFAPTSSADDLEENDLKGTTEITATDRTNYTYYVLANGDYGIGFYRYENANLPANKAYLRVDGAYNSGSNAPGVRIVEATDNATDIKSVETEKEVIKFIQNGQLYIQRDGIVYDALGRVIR